MDLKKLERKYLIAHSEWLDLIPSADDANYRLSAIVQEIIETPARSRSEVFIKARVARRLGSRAERLAILQESAAFAPLDERPDFERAVTFYEREAS